MTKIFRDTFLTIHDSMGKTSKRKYAERDLHTKKQHWINRYTNVYKVKTSSIYFSQRIDDKGLTPSIYYSRMSKSSKHYDLLPTSGPRR